MVDGREDAVAKMEGLQSVCCWVPTEPNLRNQQPICKNYQDKDESVQGNWQEQGINETNQSGIGEFLPGTQCRTAPAICSSKDFVRLTGVVPDSSLNSLSFGNLLALVHTQGKRVVGDSVATSSSSAVCFHPVDEGNHLTVKLGNSPLQDQESGLEGNHDGEPNLPKAFTDGGSIPPKPCFDLNLPLPASTDAASCKNKSSQFEPETPLKDNKSEYSVPHSQYLSMEDAQHEMKESSVTSRQLQEHHKLGNRGEDQVNFISTPEQKPSRKKRIPRVTNQGKRKRTPKNTAAKRKYVRKNRIHVPEDGEACIPPTSRRFPSFNLDNQEIGQSSLNCLSSSCNRVSQAENLNAKDPSKRTVQCGLEIVLMIDQRDTGIPHDQENMLAEKIGAESNLPNAFTDGSSIPSEPYFDLNLLPKTITNAALDKATSSQFELETPEKNTKDEHWVPPRQHLNTEDVLAGKGRQKNEVTGSGVMELHETKELSQQVINQSIVISGQLQENHKPDKRGKDQLDSIKTQQKPSRKKHMPRVSIEGKQSGTPESSEVKLNLQQKTIGVKRKYVRGREKKYQPVDQIYLVSTPQKKPRRKKHRPRVISEDKQKGTPKKTPVKRKYVKRNGTYAPEDGKPYMLHTRNSCRRFLNFNLDDQEKEHSPPYGLSSNCNRGSEAENLNGKDQSKRTVQCGQEIVVMADEPDTGISHEFMHLVNQVPEGFMERPGQSHSSSTNMHLLKNNHSVLDELLSTRGKWQMVFSDVSHDKEIKSSSMSTNHDEQRTGKSLIDLICSSTCLTPERQNWKMQNMTKTAEAENCNRNDTATFDNSMENCLSLFFQTADNNRASRLYFPAICKRRRSRRRRNMVITPLHCIASSTDNHAKLGKCITRYSSTMLSTSVTHATDRNKGQNQVLEHMLALRPKERIKKRRSKGRKRLRDLSSLLEIHKMLPAFPGRAPNLRNGQDHRILREPRVMGTLAMGTWRTTIRKKRSKRNVHITSKVQYNQQKSSVIFMGLPLALTWNGSPSVDSITKQLNQLDLNVESIQKLSHQNALVKCNTRLEQHALVPFQKYGAVVPFDSSFDQDKRGRLRPKVDIDDETTRVWKLLLENINSEGIDGTDEENTTRWREERRVFSGRAESFIARMRLVQGDRRFSPWKGSVVDSVVGVFLTQNVSDHLSSSAFISLAAQFPANTQIHPANLQEEKLCIIVEEPEVYDIDPEGIFKLNKEILNQPVYSGEDTEMPQDYNIIQKLCNVRSSGNSSSGFVSKGNLTEHNLVQSFETITNKSASFIEDGRDREDENSSEKSADSPTAQTNEKGDSCALSSTSEEQTTGAESNRFTSSTSFVKLLQMAGTILERDPNEKLSDQDWLGQSKSESLATNLYTGDHLNNATFPAEPVTLTSESVLHRAPNLGGQATLCDLSHEASKCCKSSSKKELHAAEISELSSEPALQTRIEKMHSSLEGSKFCSSNAQSSNNDQADINQTSQVPTYGLLEENNSEMQVLKVATSPQHTTEVSKIVNSKNPEDKDVDSNKNDPDYRHDQIINGQKAKKRGRTSIKEEKQVKWDNLRKQAHAGARERVRTANTVDSVDWDAVRYADVNEVANIIKERGMNNMLAQRIKDFLNRLVRDHGSIDLEWLRDVPPDKAKEYLLSIRGLGLKSVECVRLLTLHHVAFPVDTNVGRIAVRLGWVPLQPLPQSIQLHLLELYPVLESIQKYLWPRLCKLDQGTLYELHYQMITFGKVFCTKSKPNCNACPMRGECRHFASAFASARLALPAPEEKGIMCTNEKRTVHQNPMTSMNTLQLPLLQSNQMDAKSGAVQPIIEEPSSPEPIIEVPTTPESIYTQISDPTIEDAFSEESEEIPTIHLNMEELTHNLQEIMQQNKELVDGDVSKALVALTSETASIPVPKLKNVSRLRTEHQVYELPDSHPLLEGMDKREPDDPSPYLLAIWTPGETVDSIQPPERWCSSQGLDKLCTNVTCPSCNSIREANSQTVRGTLLIPCRTAMRGSFPLNGTYFQVNEVFSDHESSLLPFIVPRAWLWNLPRRTVFFGTSIPTIFKGLSTEGIQYCFWRGFVCVRGFDRKTRAPRPLVARLHFPASKLGRRKGI